MRFVYCLTFPQVQTQLLRCLGTSTLHRIRQVFLYFLFSHEKQGPAPWWSDVRSDRSFPYGLPFQVLVFYLIPHFSQSCTLRFHAIYLSSRLTLYVRTHILKVTHELFIENGSNFFYQLVLGHLPSLFSYTDS